MEESNAPGEGQMGGGSSTGTGGSYRAGGYQAGGGYDAGYQGSGASGEARGYGYGSAALPTLAISVEPAEVTPGEVSEARFAVRNDGGVPILVAVEVAGLAPDSVRLPGLLGPLDPGQTVASTIGVTVAPGYPPSDLRTSVRAFAVEPSSGSRWGRPATADLLLHVSETGLLEVSMPDEVFGAFRARFDVLVRNRGREPTEVEISGNSPVGATVQPSRRNLRLGPSGEALVRARVESGRALTGHPRRVPFSVRVKGRGAPVTLGATFVQRPWLSSLFMRALAIFTTVAFIAAAGIFIVLSVSNHYAPKVTAPLSAKVGAAKSAVPKVKVPKVTVPKVTVPKVTVPAI